MFSGIKSLLFGYSEPDENSSTSNHVHEASNEKSSTSLVVSETSSLLEQTLNAATTKLTEQLLPQSASIEELQSSSHHLLPTLVEQHEEDEKRKQNSQISLEKVEASNSYDADQEDDCFNVESWEMLDFNETPNSNIATIAKENSKENPSSDVSTNTVKVQQNFNNKQTGGILKQRESSESNNKGSKQEAKVSFKTPCLVKDLEQEKIDSKTAPKNNKKRSKNKRNKHVKDVAKSVELSAPELKVNLAQSSQPTEKPAMNYRAAALSSKNSAEKIEPNLNNGRVSMKSNRPASSSSCSSSDEVETVELSNAIWKDQAKPASSKAEKEGQDDNQSVISSEFSDCDYGYQGLRDFVMRPKKATNNKTPAQNSASTGHEPNSSANLKCLKLASKDSQPKSDTATTDSGSTKPSKNTKPKKKIGLSPTATLQNLLKNEDAKQLSITDTSSLWKPTKPVAQARPETKKRSKSKLANSKPKVKRNDPSDIADMDESWYVTPPPCFTGSNKFCGPRLKPKESSARENALIEHPSIYLHHLAI